MTDDQLETLLRDTFRSREALADPALAQDVARSLTPLPPRRWPAYVAAAAAVVAIGLVAAVLVGTRTEEPQPTLPAPSPQVATTTYRENRAIALAEARRLVVSVPLPAGATETDESAWPGGNVGMSPSDPSLRQTTVWRVPVDARSLAPFLRTHSLEGATATDEGSSQQRGGPVVRSLGYPVPSSAPAATSDTTVLVQWVPDGDGTLVRVDAMIAARAPRTAATFLDADISAVDIERVVRHSPHNQALPDVRLEAPADGADIAALAQSVNGLVGSIRPRQVVSCPPQSVPAPMTHLTFHTSDGEVSYRLRGDCLPQVQVRRDGTDLRPTLDPGDLEEAVESAVGSR